MVTVDTNAIRAAMLAQGIGTMEFASRAGVLPKVASLYATGKQKRARIPTVTKLARGLNVSPMELVKREDNDGD